jgi:hypothetical protein
MSIDQFTDGINIKELTFPEPKKTHESPINLQEVSNKQWDAMVTLSKNALAQMLSLRPEQENDPDSDILHKSIRGLAIVAPEKVQDLMDDESWEILMSQMQRWGRTDVSGINVVSAFLEKTVSLKLLSPQRAAKTPIITDMQWSAIIGGFENRIRSNNNTFVQDALSIAAEVKLLNPQMTSEFDLGDDGRRSIEECIKEYEQRMHAKPHSKPALINLIKDYKIVEPERFKMLQISDASWQKIWDYESSQLKLFLDSDIREAAHGSFASGAAPYLEEIAILSADEIHVTDSGVKFIHNKLQGSLQDTGGKMPEQRKF